jgi:hypothetical protein
MSQAIYKAVVRVLESAIQNLDILKLFFIIFTTVPK